MAPLLPDGVHAVFRRRWRGRYRAGDIVLADHPRFGRIVKRVSGVAPDGALLLEGLSPHSTSAERLGSVPPNAVLGALLCKIPG